MGGVFVGDPDAPGRLERLVDGGGQPTGWEFTDENDAVEVYDVNGLLLSITTRTGFTQTLTYNASNQLTQIADDFTRTLTLTYDASGQWDTMTDPAGNVYSYAYTINGNLDTVTYPDETPLDPLDNPTRQYHYDDAVNPDALTGITNENGVVFVTWTYDSDGRVIANSRAGGADSITISYDDVAGTSTLTDALGEARTYTFNTLHDQIHTDTVSGSPCTTDCGSRFASYTQDANGYPASRTDHNGNVTTFVHDARGLETSRTEAVGTLEERTITTQWHATFRIPELIAEPGKTTAFTYDAQGRLLTRNETDTATSATRTVTNTYNAQGLLATRDGPRTDVTDVTTFTYDAQGNLTQTTNAEGHISQVTAYDVHGRPLTLEDPNGLITTLAYDARNRLVNRTVGGQPTTFEYDGVGNVTKTTLPDSSFLISEYDDAQRLVALENNLGERTEFALDAAGNRIGEDVKDPSSAITRTRTRIYDAVNRLIQDIGGANQTTDFEYDLQGNQTAVIVDSTGLNQRTTSEYDALNRLAKSIDPDLGEADFAYDARDNLVSVTDAESLVTTYTYDGLENLTVQSSPDTGQTQFSYDDAGNRLTQTDARSVLATFSYDALNRLVSIVYPDTTKNIGFEYDQGTNGVGRLTRMTDESGSTDFVYDIRGNLLSEVRTIDGVAYATTYSHDSADRVLTITYPSTTIVTNTRDAIGRIDSVSATTGGTTQPLASNISYLPFGPVDGISYGNGITLSRAFDQDYRLTSHTAGSVQNVSLGYDPANNITTLTDVLNGANDQAFTYEGLNRLSQGQGIYGTQDYSYDGIGNRTTLTAAAGADTYSYGPSSHRLDAITGPNAANFSYDANGNTVAKGPQTFTYDDTNRMTEALASSVVVGQYVYNGKGERVKKTAGGATTIYHYDAQGQLIAESDTAGNIQREYVYVNGEPLALVVPNVSVPIEVIIDNSSAAFTTTNDWESRTDGTGAIGGEFVRQRTDMPPVGGILVDDLQATLVGSWKQKTSTNTIGGAFHRAKAGAGDATATWSVSIPAAGDYRVFGTWRSMNGVAPDVPYTINHSGGSTVLVVDQTQNNNTWTELGVFTFDAGATTISLENTLNGKAAADAIYVVDVNASFVHTATWSLNVPASGEYEVYANWPDGIDSAVQDARFNITHDGGANAVVVNQRINGNQWNLLGTFNFSAGTGFVLLIPPSSGWKHVLADAIRIVKTATPPAGPPEFYTYANDHLGTPLAMVDENGVVAWEAFYEPFGNALVTINTVSNNLRFPGQYFDAETGLHYNYFRDYDPSTGRYLKSDPIGIVGGLATYAYAAANPLRFIDPRGLDCYSANGTATCETPSGLIVSFPVPDDWPAYIGPEANFYHDYIVPVHGLVDPSRILNGLINDPTPGEDFCATASGTPNDSGIGPVRSYVVTDRISGKDVVVNVTEPGHIFHPGYVARSVSSSVGGITVTNEGEGQSVLQSFDLLVDPGAQVLWGRLTQGVFARGGDAIRCGCGT